MATHGCSEKQEGELKSNEDHSIAEDLKFLSGKRIFFGHQSVGANIIEGIKRLEADQHVSLTWIQVADGDTLPGAYFADSYIGENTKPDSKCDAFSSMLDSRFQDSVDIALMKFCYVDFTSDTDVHHVFSIYQRMIDSLKSQNPRTLFIHVTTPLMSLAPKWKRIVFDILGRNDYIVRENAKRNLYNDLLLSYYKTHEIFDLASIESTYPDGSRESFDYDGTTYYALVRDYTYDGGHLNEIGQTIVARELMTTLASALRSWEKTRTR